jgi:hypothetical protein
MGLAKTATQYYRTEELPPAVRREANKTITEDWEWNAEGELRWYLTEVPLQELLGGDDNGEEFENWSQTLARKIISSKRFDPIVIGPCGIEGNHRIRAAEILGMKMVPAWRYIEAETGEAFSAGS